jgi:chitinase
MLAPSLGVARILVIPLLLAYLVTAVSVPDSLSSYLAAHPISTTSGDLTKAPVDLSNLSTKALPPVVANSARSRCPASCDDAGLDPINWTVYHDVNRLSWCNQTMLLDFALYNSLDDPRTHASIRCCSASPEVATSSGAATSSAAASRVDKRGNATSGTSCLSKGNQTQVQESLQMAFNGPDASGSVSDFVEASQQMASYLVQQKPSCNQTVTFTYSGSAVVGLFAGSGIQSQGIAASVLQQFIASVESSGYSESVLVQLCSGNNRSSRYSMGIIANADADVGFVQDAVATWASGGCVTTYDRADTWQNITLSIPNHPTSTNGTLTNGTFSATHAARALAPRTTCSTVQVASGDTCKYSQSFEP